MTETSGKMNIGIIAKEAKNMKNYTPIALIVWRLYVFILVPSLEDVSAPVKGCRKNFKKKYEETMKISDEDFKKVMVALESLPEKEREVIVLRFGLEDGIPKSLEDVGRVRGVTRERIRQLEARAFRMLRNPSRLCKFPALFGFVPPAEPESEVSKVINIDTDIVNLGLSVRAYNCLKRYAHISTVEDILDYPKENWPKIKNLGYKAILEIQERMRTVGYPNFTILS